MPAIVSDHLTCVILMALPNMHRVISAYVYSPFVFFNKVRPGVCVPDFRLALSHEKH